VQQKRWVLGIALIVLAATAGSGAPASAQDFKVSDQPYVRIDGGSDPRIASCGDDDPGPGFGGNWPQAEPAVAIKPDEPDFIAAGANDLCTFPVNRDENVGWEGVYFSADGGESWVNSLLPGYPGDASAEGRASPVSGHNRMTDPTMDWDEEGNLFVGGIAFNCTADPFAPSNADAFVVAYRRAPASPLGVAYERTAIVAEGTPSPLVCGIGGGVGNDKPALRVDDQPGSPHRGSLYVAWARFPGRAAQIVFSRSTDHGRTFSRPIALVQTPPNFANGAEIAVGPEGEIYVLWRVFATRQSPLTMDAIAFVKSTDGGRSFTRPRAIRAIVPHDRGDQYLDGGFARDCSVFDPVLCRSGFVFHRAITFVPQATVDAAGSVYVSWEQVAPAADNGDTYHPDGQAQVVVAKSADGGQTWSQPARVDPQPVGHQFFPDLAYEAVSGSLVLIYYDSRADPSYSVNRPPGNRADGTSACGAPIGSQICDVLNTFVATSTDGAQWSTRKISSVGHQPEYPVYGDVFHGDYISVDVAPGRAYGVWTDNRDVIPGDGPRGQVVNGFGVLQCRADPSVPDQCPNAGGRNQNIYGAPVALP
jgi:hypothetical protein